VSVYNSCRLRLTHFFLLSQMLYQIKHIYFDIKQVKVNNVNVYIGAEKISFSFMRPNLDELYNVSLTTLFQFVYATINYL